MMPAIASAAANGEQFHPNQSPLFLFGMFTLYVANYFVIVFFNVALVGVANSRLMGGTWTFRDGLELAWARKGTIFRWALVAPPSASSCELSKSAWASSAASSCVSLVSRG